MRGDRRRPRPAWTRHAAPPSWARARGRAPRASPARRRRGVRLRCPACPSHRPGRAGLETKARAFTYATFARFNERLDVMKRWLLVLVSVLAALSLQGCGYN